MDRGLFQQALDRGYVRFRQAHGARRQQQSAADVARRDDSSIDSSRSVRMVGTLNVQPRVAGGASIRVAIRATLAELE